MTKRRGNFSQSQASGSGIKRQRENGRLKILEPDSDSSDGDMQEKILTDAGLDHETMKSIPDSERRAIIRAIMESNQVKDVVMVDSSDSSGSKDNISSSAQLILAHQTEGNEEETQPPEGLFDVGRRNSPANESSRGNSPECCDIDIPPQHERIPSQEVLEDRPQNSKRFADLKKPIEEEDVEQEEDLIEMKEISPVLVAETQFFPCNRSKEEVDVCDVIPESPTPTSPDSIVDKDIENNEDEELIQETNNGVLNRVYPVRATVYTHGFRRLSPGTVKNCNLYTKVIKSIFDIYIRRLRLANVDMKAEPVKWGDPVKTGLHCENLLRRRPLVCDRAEMKNGKRGGKGRRRILRRNLDNNTDSVSVDDENEKNGTTCLQQDEPTVATETENIARDDISNDPNDRCDMVAQNVFDLDNDSSDEFDKRKIAKKSENISDLENSKSGRDTRRRTKMHNKDHVSSHISSNSNEYRNEGSTDLSLSLSLRNLPLPQISHENENTIPETDFEILDDGSIRHGPWLNVKNVKNSKKNVLNTKDMKKAKTKTDTPRVTTKSILKRKGKKEDLYQSTISKVFISDKSQCQIIEDDETEGFHIQPHFEKEKELKQTNIEKLGKLSTEGNFNDDVPSSVESTYLLNSQGEMYSTQMTKIKIAERKNRLEKKDNMSNQTRFVKVPNLVSSRLRDNKSSSSSVEEIEIIEEDNAVNKSKNGGQTESSCFPFSCGSKRRMRKRKSASVEEIVILQDPENGLGVSDGTCIEKSNRKQSLCIEQHETIDVSGANTKDIVEKSLTSSNTENQVKSELRSESGADFCVENKRKGKKKKKKLFNVDAYTFTDQSTVNCSSIDQNTARQFKQNEESDLDQESECSGIEIGSNQNFRLQEKRPTTSSHCQDQMETVVSEGTCPICDKIFKLDKLESHAATCGEGTTEDEASSTVECMICHKEIASEILKEHQTKCVASRVLETEEEVAPARITRAKKSANNSSRKNTVLREKSPSSSGEDYGELVVEMKPGNR